MLMRRKQRFDLLPRLRVSVAVVVVKVVVEARDEAPGDEEKEEEKEETSLISFWTASFSCRKHAEGKEEDVSRERE